MSGTVPSVHFEMSLPSGIPRPFKLKRAPVSARKCPLPSATSLQDLSPSKSVPFPNPYLEAGPCRPTGPGCPGPGGQTLPPGSATALAHQSQSSPSPPSPFESSPPPPAFRRPAPCWNGIDRPSELTAPEFGERYSMSRRRSRSFWKYLDNSPFSPK